MKKILSFLLVFVMIFSFVACDGTQTNSDYGITPDTQSSSYTSGAETVASSSIESITSSEEQNNSSSTYEENNNSIVPSTSQGSSQSNSVTVPKQEESVGVLVWVPTHGGKKYHTKSSCSNMKDPMQVTIETAQSNGYGPCSKCY